jgi:multidrug efflux pump subunit AcrA (membrane-fusion protein)
VLLSTLAFLFVVPTRLKIGAEGSVEPLEKRFVFVSVPGTVTRILVKDQQLVQQGDVLVETDNPDLAVQLQEVRGQHLVAQQRLATTRQMLNAPRLTQDERNKLAGQVLELTQTLESLEQQIALRERQVEELKIRAPASGRIMLSWDVERSLLGRKVEPGQILMAVADPNGPWELELAMPDRRMGHVNRARQELKPDLDVDFVLATDPRQRHRGRIAYVDQVTRVENDLGHHVLIRVDIDEEPLRDQLRPGAKVHARIDCGRTSWGYRLFYEAIAWVQTRLLF